MPKRSITDYEISLIKALLARNTRNKDIQFFFNRPDRAVNSGRITGIRKGIYGNSAAIPAATDETLDAFLKGKTETVAADVAVAVPAALDVVPDGPLSEQTIRSLFWLDEDGTWRLVDGESDEHESKRGFSFKYSSKWLRAIAALSNTKGGYVLFGVHDKEAPGSANFALSDAVVGLQTAEFEAADASKFAELLRSTFDPTPVFKITTCEIGQHTIGVVYVNQHPARPVIARCAQGEEIKEGDILYRYPGQSRRIKYSDLRTLLDDRDRVARQDIMPMVERILRLGAKNAMVADFTTGELTDGRTSLLLQKDLLDDITFIREGEFDEVSGAPTLRVVGNVMVGDHPEHVVKGAISRMDVLEAALQQARVPDPKGYLGFVVDGCSGQWLPFRQFVEQAELTKEEAISFIGTTSAPRRRKGLFQSALQGSRTAFYDHGYSARQVLKRIRAGEEIAVEQPWHATDVSRAIQGLSDSDTNIATKALELLRRCMEVLGKADKSAASSTFRRALARVDEVLHPLSELQEAPREETIIPRGSWTSPSSAPGL